jgi:hypothetical protein
MDDPDGMDVLQPETGSDSAKTIPEKRVRSQQPSGEELVQIRRRAKTILANELAAYDCTSLGLRESMMKLLVNCINNLI